MHPTYKKQKEIERKIRSYLGNPGDAGKTWTELYKKASADKISKSTLSRYLKQFIEEEGSVVQDVNRETYPVTVSYRRNQPRSLEPKKTELLEKQLAVYQEYAARGEHPAIGYYDKFIWILFDMIAIHVWASRFQNPKIAARWIRVMTEITLNDTYNLGQEAPILMKHQKAVHDSARDYLMYFMRRFRKGRMESKFAERKFIEDYLAFDPMPTFRAMKTEPSSSRGQQYRD